MSQSFRLASEYTTTGGFEPVLNDLSFDLIRSDRIGTVSPTIAITCSHVASPVIKTRSAILDTLGTSIRSVHRRYEARALTASFMNGHFKG